MADEECTDLVVYTQEDCCVAPTQSNGPVVTVPGPPGPQGPPGPPGDAGCPLFCGMGSPEGVVDSPIGGIYEQTDAASTSHSVWHKHSGTGNTGWRQWAGLRGDDGDNTAIRIGDNSIASGVDSIAIGEDAEATGVSAIALGKNTLAAGDRAEAIGQDSEATADDAKAFGSGAVAGGAGSIAVGKDANAGEDAADVSNVVIGDGASAYTALEGFSGESVVIGKNARAGSDGVIVIGPNNGQNFADGWTDVLRGVVLIGSDIDLDNDETNTDVIAIGREVHLVGDNVLAIGAEAAVLPAFSSSGGSEGMAIGHQAQAVDYDVVVGFGAQDVQDEQNNGNVIVGHTARNVFGNCNVVVGFDASIEFGDGSTSIGSHTYVKADESVSIGTNSNITSTDPEADWRDICLGVFASITDSKDCIAIGHSAGMTGRTASIALGTQAAPSADNQMMIGSATAPIDEIKVMTSGGLKTVTLV